MKLSLSNVAKLTIAILLTTTLSLAKAGDTGTIIVMRGFSSPLRLSEDAGTIAIGDPSLIGVSTIKPNLLMIIGQDTGATSLTVFGKSGAIYQYRVQVGNDVAQLKGLIASFEKKVSVEDINGTIVLKGEVKTPAALARILSIADRFVGAAGEPDFSVISDKGGVLSGNLDESSTVDAVAPTLALQTFQGGFGGNRRGNIGGNGGNGGNGANNGNRGGGRGGGGAAAGLNQQLMSSKGNLAQNISRGDVVMVAGGRVMSLIRVAEQPKVEIQMRIVGVDRNKTDEFGIDWRLDGNKISIGSSLGGFAPNPVPTATPGQDLFSDISAAGTISALFTPGQYSLAAFLRAIERKGAATTLSEPLITAVSGETASFLAGGNIPIPVQTLAPGTPTSNPIVATNVAFIEFGLRLIVRPTVLENGKISIVLDQSISAPNYDRQIQILGTPIPSFTQRTVSTITESESGETWAVAGLLSEENSKQLRGIPWLSDVPVIGWLFKNRNDSITRNELMILVNARRVDGVDNTTTSFDGIGAFATETNNNSTDLVDKLPDESSSHAQENQKQPVTQKNTPVITDKKKRVYREIKQPSMINSENLRLGTPTNSLIKPEPVAGRSYKDIRQPDFTKSNLN